MQQRTTRCPTTLCLYPDCRSSDPGSHEDRPIKIFTHPLRRAAAAAATKKIRAEQRCLLPIPPPQDTGKEIIACPQPTLLNEVSDGPSLAENQDEQTRRHVRAQNGRASRFLRSGDDFATRSGRRSRD